VRILNHIIHWRGYQYPSWDRHIIIDLNAVQDNLYFRVCDMKVVDLNRDENPDLFGRKGFNNDRDGITCWVGHPGAGKISCAAL
jgi:hypothetical protein